MRKATLNSLQKKWNIVNDQSNMNYDVGNEIVYNTHILKFNLSNFNDVYINITTASCNLGT